MESKKIKNGNASIIAGVNAVADTVKVTLGPKGKCVAIQDGFDTPQITRDGATVAKAISLPDPIENMGAQIAKQAAKDTESAAGDSTSSTVVLLQELLKNGKKYIDSGDYNINEVKNGMEKAQKWVTDYIKNNAIEVKDDLEKIRKVATISANNDPEVGNFIVEGMKKVGIDGVLTAEMSSGLETAIDVRDGFRLNRGWASPHFVTSPVDGVCELNNPVILVCGEKLSTIPQIQNILVQLSDPQTGAIRRPLLIICDDCDEVIMTMLVVNVLNRALSCCVVKGIDFGDARKNLMADTAVAVGAQYVCPENNLKLENSNIDVLGEASRVVIDKDTCTIYDGAGDKTAIADRLAVLKAKLADPDLSDYEKTKIQKRVACLGNGICLIKAGGASEVEKQNRKATIEDAILASQSAIAEGVVPGGGYMLLSAQKEITKNLKSEKLTASEAIGVKILLESLPVITKTIAENSGVCGDVVLEKISSKKVPNFGYNAKTGTYGDLLNDGVLDSAKALHIALDNAVSAAAMILLTDKTVTIVKDDKCCCGECKG